MNLNTVVFFPSFICRIIVNCLIFGREHGQIPERPEPRARESVFCSIRVGHWAIITYFEMRIQNTRKLLGQCMATSVHKSTNYNAIYCDLNGIFINGCFFFLSYVSFVKYDVGWCVPTTLATWHIMNVWSVISDKQRRNAWRIHSVGGKSKRKTAKWKENHFSLFLLPSIMPSLSFAPNRNEKRAKKKKQKEMEDFVV